MDPDMFQPLEDALKVGIIIAAVTVPLGLWKLGEILYWLLAN